jgi:hypothetical protein
MDTITPQQGLEVVAQALQQFRGTRADHDLLERAFRAVQEGIKPNESKPAPGS